MPVSVDSAGHSDMRLDGWVERYLPESFRPYAYLMRLDRPIGTWLLLLPSLWGIFAASGGVLGTSFSTWVYVLLFSIGAVIMRGAGCVINDLWDKDFDKKVTRTMARPLAAGTVSVAKAMMLLAVLLWLGLIILVSLSSGTAIFLGVVAMVFVIVYPLAKRVTWYPQFLLGVVFNVGVLMGYATISGDLSLVAWLLYFSGVCWTLGYDTIYAWQDRDDDMLIGIRSTAVKFGDNSPLWVFGFYSLASFFLLASGFAAQAGPVFYGLWAVVSLHFIYQFYTWRLDSPDSALALFRSNRLAGVIILCAWALGFIIL